MIEIVRNFLKYTGIFRLSKVEDKKDQVDYTRVVMITGIFVLVMVVLINFII